MIAPRHRCRETRVRAGKSKAPIFPVGLTVKNGIKVDSARRMRLQGETLGVTLRVADRVRLRPILMTTLCALYALLPLGLGVDAAAELQRPLSLAVIGGLALSTPVTLVPVPTVLIGIRGEGYLVRLSAGETGARHEADGACAPAPAAIL